MGCALYALICNSIISPFFSERVFVLDLRFALHAIATLVNLIFETHIVDLFYFDELLALTYRAYPVFHTLNCREQATRLCLIFNVPIERPFLFLQLVNIFLNIRTVYPSFDNPPFYAIVCTVYL